MPNTPNRLGGAGADTTNPVTTVETAFEILDTVQARDGATVTEIAAELNLAKSTVHRHVRTLEALGYLINTDQTYSIGLRFLEHGMFARDKVRGFDLASVKARELADATEEVAQFMAVENGRGIILVRKEGARAVKTASKVGRPTELHATSLGKAILSMYTDNEIRELVDRNGLSKMTDQTITDIEVLLDDIEATRQRGYAINNEEYTHGVRSVAAPITTGNGNLIGSLAIGAPTYRMTDERLDNEIVELLLGAVNEIGVNITYS